METIASLVQTGTSIFAIVIAIYALYKEGKRARFSLGIEILLDKGKYFNSAEFKDQRKKTAKIMRKIIYSIPDGGSANFSTQSHHNKDQILDFFQTIGSLTKEKVLDLKFVWSEYSYWLIHYWEFFYPAVQIDRDEHGEYFWEDVEWLYQQFEKKFTKRKCKVDFIGFVEYELSLK